MSVGGLADVQFDAITMAIRRLAATLQSLVPAPRRYIPANTVYIDPSAGSNGAGTFASPLNALPTFVANTAYLFKAGTTYVGSLTVTVAATETTPVVIGAYDAVTGRQIACTPGAATINANGATSGLLIGQGSAYVEINSLAVTNTAGTNGWGIALNSSISAISNCQVLYCSTTGLPGAGMGGVFNTQCNNNTFYGNVIDGGLDGIIFGGNAGFDGLSVVHNLVRGVTRHGLRWSPWIVSALTKNFLVAQNVIYNVGFHGMYLQGAGQNVRVILNTVVRAVEQGIQMNGSFGFTQYTDLRIAGNTVMHTNMGIHTGGVRGSVVIEWNTCWRNGSWDGINPINATSKYGRGIEVYGGTFATNSDGFHIRQNSCCEQYNFGGVATNATEGVGIGIDNNSTNMVVYGNYVARNEGNGIQPYVNDNCMVHGNLLVDNFALPASKRGNTIPSRIKSQLFIAECSRVRVFNNTVVSTGACPLLVYAMSAHQTTTSNKECVVANNTIVGHARGIAVNTGVVESYNRFKAIDSANWVYASVTELPAAAAASDIAVAYDLPAPTYSRGVGFDLQALEMPFVTVGLFASAMPSVFASQV